MIDSGSKAYVNETLCGSPSVFWLAVDFSSRHIASSERAFCAIRQDGTVVTWGDAAYGGDCRMVQHLLVDVHFG